MIVCEIDIFKGMSLKQFKAIIKQYVEENNIKEMNIYIDDLYAGKKKVEVYVR